MCVFSFFLFSIFSIFKALWKKKRNDPPEMLYLVPKVIILKGGARRFLLRFIHILKIIFWPEKKNFFSPKFYGKLDVIFPSHLTKMFYTVILSQKFELWIRFQFRVPGRALIKEQYRKNIVVFLKIAELYQKKKYEFNFFFVSDFLLKFSF